MRGRRRRRAAAPSTSRLFPIPGTPTSVTNCTVRSRRARATCRGSGAAPPCGRRAVQAAALRRPPVAERARKRLVDRDGISLALRLEIRRSPYSIAAGSRGTCTRRRGRCRVRRLLDPEGRRDDVADRDALAGTGDRVHLDDRLPVLTRPSRRESRRGSRARRGPRARGRPRERPARRRRHHGVADVLLERAAEALELAPHPRDLRTGGARDPRGRVRRRAPSSRRGRRTGRSRPCAPRRRPRDGRPAGGTEARGLGKLSAAFATRSHAPRIGVRRRRA